MISLPIGRKTSRGLLILEIGVHRDPIDDDAAILHDLDKVLHLLIGLVDHLLGIRPIGSQRITVGRVMMKVAWFRSWQLGALRSSNDHALQWIPLIPTIDNLCHFSLPPQYLELRLLEKRKRCHPL